MDLTFLRILLCRKEIKIIIISTVAGGVLQIICRRYIKSHPEFLEEKIGILKKQNLRLKIKIENPDCVTFSRAPEVARESKIRALVLKL